MIVWNSLDKAGKSDALSRPDMVSSVELSSSVQDIISAVKSQGDAALLNFTQKFDGVTLASLTYSDSEVDLAIASLTDERRQAIDVAYSQIKLFHEAQKFEDVTVETMPGVVCTLKSEAIESVGLYIPAGSAPLPSTVLMLGVPAQLAGCERKVLTCPPDKEGNICAEILYAARLCEIDKIIRIGGAQAISALALGTESIDAVNKVYGPGNRFVTEAKRQLSQQVPGFAIDMPAGPSEVLVIADDKANPEFIAADLLSQAEHGPDSQVILVTNSEDIIAKTQESLNAQLATLSRKDIAKAALAHCRLILSNSIEQSAEISNLYGPEHLIVQSEQPETLIGKLRNAGSIFLGQYTPESAGDYASGTNHVLPTYGYSKVVSSLSLADFSRRYTVQSISKEGLERLAPTIIELTNAEGLDAHQKAVTIRLQEA